MRNGFVLHYLLVVDNILKTFTLNCFLSRMNAPEKEDKKMNSNEKRAIAALASILSVRMMGLFMILPVFSIYAYQFPGATPILVGLALGIYGLTQAVFQIPFGMLSDRFGRKPIIVIGLLIFALGSIIAALSTSIVGIIIGRALQGGSAIAAAVLALASDLTREEHRTKAMAMLGMSIGLSFMLALVMGPIVSRWIGLSGIFWLTSLLAFIAILFLYTLVPKTVHSYRNTETAKVQLMKVMTNPQLFRLNLSTLLLHLMLTSLFVGLPLALAHQLEPTHHWKIYLPVLTAAFFATVPFIIFAEKRHHFKLMLVSAVGVLAVAEFGLIYLHHHLTGIVLMLFFFFTAVNLLEANLPSLISKISPLNSKGTAMGIYSTAQFFGAFLGGTCGGWLLHHYGMEAIFIFCTLLTLGWLIMLATMPHPHYLSSEMIPLGEIDTTHAHQLTECLTKVHGVAEVVVIIEEGMAYLKVDRNTLDTGALKKCPIMTALSRY